MQNLRSTSRLDCDVWWKADFIHLAMTSSVAGLRKSSKALPSHTCTKKSSGHCLVVYCPSDPRQLSESQWNHYIWEVGSADQWTPKAATPVSTSQQKGRSSPQRPTTCCTANASKVERIRLWSFTSSTIFTWPLTNRPPLQAAQQLSAGKTFPQPAGGSRYFPRIHQIPKHRFLCYRN